MTASPQRLYIITGKGGVGKTVVSLAFTRWLRQQGHDATHVTFGHHRLRDQSSPNRERPLAAWKDVPRWELDLEESAEGYIQKKLGSGLAAKWIVRTAFFRALVNMMPGFSYVIFLGRLLQTMQDHPQRIMVLDAPASGHALAMLEATANFREIFGAGAVFDDTQKMLTKLYDPTYTGLRILALPTQMAMQEAAELREAVAGIAPFDARITLNQSLESWESALAEAPAPLQAKLAMEREVRSGAGDLPALPFSAATDPEELWRDLGPAVAGLV